MAGFTSRLLLSFAALALLVTPSFAAKIEKRGETKQPGQQLTAWTVDGGHSAINFSAKHLGVAKVRGSLRGVQGEVRANEKDLTQTTVDVTISMKSLQTGVDDRDDHLKSDDFFNADKYPTAHFVSTKVTKNKDGSLRMTGNLTIRDITKEVVLSVEKPGNKVKNPSGNWSAGFSAKTKISRAQFGLKWNKIIEGVSVVSDEVEVEIDVELIAPIA